MIPRAQLIAERRMLAGFLPPSTFPEWPDFTLKSRKNAARRRAQGLIDSHSDPVVVGNLAGLHFTSIYQIKRLQPPAASAREAAG
ncbi:hypothetical protein [Hansschlegelia sp.]|uniref:hypothetical protein n=1 Tax=Hansschlegelia sp. TaxID=2041892 RepID=UPI002CC6F197|nr:hypothetical protein [Hansschlegelia sp.]HVI27500.1 hypothetical protein [Hansschlegelia sp.]